MRRLHIVIPPLIKVKVASGNLFTVAHISSPSTWRRHFAEGLSFRIFSRLVISSTDLLSFI